MMASTDCIELLRQSIARRERRVAVAQIILAILVAVYFIAELSRAVL